MLVMPEASWRFTYILKVNLVIASAASHSSRTVEAKPLEP